jgi:hypothetical protein
MKRWIFHYAIFLLVALGGVWLADSLVGLTAPGDACAGLLLTATVGLMGLLFLLAVAYLRIALVAILNERWPTVIRRRPWLHPVGVGCLVFSIATPFVFLAGPRSSLAYGERVIVTEALSRSVPVQRAVEAYFARTGQLPPSLDLLPVRITTEPAFSALRKVSLQKDGGLRLDLGTGRYPAVDQRHILLLPRVEGSRFTGWDCRGGDLPAGLRPPRCRASSVCETLGYEAARQ